MALSTTVADILARNGHFGWIPPSIRTQEQMDATVKAKARQVNFGLPFVTPPKGTKILLTDFWRSPEAVADMGREFTGFRQLTGSCVGASAGTWRTTLACIQRTLSTNPTKAFIDFWPFCYGRTRYLEGDRGQGEGAVDSVMGKETTTEGFFDITQAGLPTFDTHDGFALTEQLEMQWSDGGAAFFAQWMPVAKQHTGAVAALSSVDDIAAAILNGYPVIDGCADYVGHGSIKGSGDTAYVAGRYDGSGGHSTCFLGYWNHPNDGEQLLYSNNWDGSTYPKDPAGGGRCCVWLPRAEVNKLFTQFGGDQGETLALSSLNWFPAQPAVVDWSQL